MRGKKQDMVRYCPICWSEADDDDCCRKCGAPLRQSTNESYEEKLIWALRHPEPTTPIRAATILGERRALAAVEPLIAVALSTRDFYLQEAAVIALGQIGDRRAQPCLERLSREGAVRVRQAAQRALASLAKSLGPASSAGLQEGCDAMPGRTAVPKFAQAVGNKAKANCAAREPVMAPSDRETRVLIEQLQDPSRSNQALLGLLAKGRAAVPALAEFLRSTKPSTVAEARLLAVEGLSILKGEAALDALVEVASKRLADIPDPAVRLAEESVVSRAASALADFSAPRGRETLLKLLEGKPLVGVAEAFEKSKDPRAIPWLIAWLEEDFVARAAAGAILSIGRPAIPALLASLSKRKAQYGAETRTSQRRRARILEILQDLIDVDNIASLESLLEDPAEGVRWNAGKLFVRRGNYEQQRRGIQVALSLLDTSDSYLRADCEQLLTSYYEVGRDMIERAIQGRTKRESEMAMFPRETTLAVLLRIQRRAKCSPKVES